MESQVFRYCSVCLIPEESPSDSFNSIFCENGAVAKKINNLTGIFPIDVDKNAPLLICPSCTREVDGADVLRRRILDAHENMMRITANREKKLFEENLERLKADVSKTSNYCQLVKDKSKLNGGKNIPVYTKEKTPQTIPKGLIKRDQRCEAPEAKLISKLISGSKLPSSPRLLHIKEVTTLASRHVGKRKLSPDKKPTANRKRRNLQRRVKIPTSFECNTCERCFLSYQELNDHVKVHICE